MVEKERNARQAAALLTTCRPVLDAQRLGRKALTTIGNDVFRAVEDGTWNSARYSKSWHRQHGGVWEVAERRVEWLRRGRLGRFEVVDTVTIESFRGNWLVHAIAHLLDLAEVSVAPALRRVQGARLFGVETVRALHGVSIFRRTLAGESVDYCATVATQIYRAATPRAALSGLRSCLDRL